jgi:demethylmenaquinone methyltransferase / 2-methoxy-6-polyprenyl-1,4-benzoquinol methylase
MSAVDVEQREALAAAAGGAAKRAYVRRIFSEIAPRYDLLNHLLSLNIDKRWRKLAIGALQWERCPDGVYLDVCAGTMDVGAQLAERAGFRGYVIGADFAEPMLRIGKRKARRLPLGAAVADAMQLPMPDASSAGAIVAFGVRNFDDLDAGLREIHRTLAPGARLVILEFSTPGSAALRTIYHFYFHRVLPLVGRLVSGHPTAYRYLPASVSNFPGVEELGRRMDRAGFVNVGWKTLSFGIAAVHWGERGGRGAAA